MFIKVIKVLGVLLVTAILVVACLIPQWVKTRIEQSLSFYFQGATIHTGTVGLEDSFSFAISDISIHAKEYNIDVKRVSLDRQWNLTLDEPQVTITAPFVIPVQADKKAPNNNSLPITLRVIHLKNLKFQIKQKDMDFELKGSLDINPSNLNVKNLTLVSSGFKKGSMSLKDIVLDIPEDNQGVVTIEKFQYNKLRINSLKSQVKLDIGSRKCSFYGLSASLIEGIVTGSAEVLFNQRLEYRGDLELASLNLAAFTKDFELEKKMSAAGLLVGKINFSGDSFGLKELAGTLSVSDKGGDLVIEDKEFLNTLAKNSRAPIEVVEASVKEYHFDTGKLSMDLNNKNIGFSINLDGPKGKRSFQVTLHDIF